MKFLGVLDLIVKVVYINWLIICIRNLEEVKYCLSVLKLGLN